MNAAECLWTPPCELGEGCVWDGAGQRLLFVDILQPALLAWTPASSERRRWAMPEMIGWLVPRARGGWVAGLASGVAALDWDAAAAPDAAPRLTWLHRLHAPGSPLRLNDAKADARGRLWFGSMNHLDHSRPDGCLYRLDTDGTLEVVDDGYGVSNGPTFSLDGRTLFHTDTVARCIYAFDVDAAGRLQRKRVWKRIEGPDTAEGHPDGMCTDAEDHLWVARWGAGCVTRLDPDGREAARVRTGAPHTTNCAFGGPDLADLYITSARVELDAAALAAAPRSGSLFVARGAGRGLAPGVFGG
jgi:sugar lactone lactonase YvrE